jgi:hypothetical protein
MDGIHTPKLVLSMPLFKRLVLAFTVDYVRDSGSDAYSLVGLIANTVLCSRRRLDGVVYAVLRAETSYTVIVV